MVQGIQIADFFVVKRQALDIPALYDPHGRYAYKYGINWRAALALLAAVGPTLPGLINSVNPDIPIYGAGYLRDLNWYYGIFSSALVYVGSSWAVPAHESLVPTMIWSIDRAIEDAEGAEKDDEKVATLQSTQLHP